MTRRLLLLTSLLAVAACDQRIDSPKLTLASVMPQVVCDAQLTTQLKLSGDGMTPLPIRTLGGTGGKNQPQSIQLPAISLIESATLDGMMSTGAPIAIPDDPDDTANSHVKWASEMAMSFEVFPSLMLPDGVYDIQVTNPDGKSSATLPHAFAAVPPPHVTKVQPAGICDAQSDQTIIITGTGFLEIGMTLPTITFTPMMGASKTYTPTKLDGCAPIAAMVVPGLQICTTMTIIVKKGDLPPGNYTVSVTNPEPANCKSSEPIIVKISPPPVVTGVTPMTICQGGGGLDVKGMDFQDTPTVALGMSMAGNVKFMSSMEVTATFGGGNVMFTPGMKYDLTLTNPDGCSSTLKDAVTAIAGPVLFFVDPPVVFNGINTQVTMFATSVAAPLMSVVITPSSAMCAGAVPVTLTAMIDPMHPKHILAVIPKGTIACDYDVTVTDSSGCPATLPKGVKVVDKATLMLTAVIPPFGWEGGATPVTITAQGGLTATPRAYLNPHNAGMNTVATALSSVAFVSATKLTAIVPKGVDHAANPYDLIVLNPDGTVGVLMNAYKSDVNPPPVVTGISPQSFTVPPQAAILTITGTNFRMPSVTVTCTDNAGAPDGAPFMPVPSASTATSITVDFTAGLAGVVSPAVCVIRVTDGDDMSYFDFNALAIAGAAGKLSTSTAGTDLLTPVRAPSMVANAATAANRFLYVIGGDSGTAAGAMNSVQTNTADQTGVGATWWNQRYTLNAKRTLAGAASLGRYIYIAGGNDSAGPVATVERAMVLDPQQAPAVTDIDIVPGMGMGLGGGTYYYRVAALMDPNDADNPGGETLPSDETTLTIPDSMSKLQVTLTWSAVPGAVGYRIYRSPMPNMIPGQEKHLADVANVLTFVDMGGMTIANDPPALIQGSTGKWRVLPAMAHKRESPGVVFGTDPMNANLHYLYVTFGSDGAARGDYEYLPVTVGNGGAQTFTTFKVGAQTGAARYFHSAYSVDSSIASVIPAGQSWIFVGGGTANGNQPLQALDGAKVAAGGDLGSFAASGKTFKHFACGTIAASDELYQFSGDGASLGFDDAFLTNAPPAVSNVSNNGSGLKVGRFAPGSTVLGAIIYLAGGSDATMMTAMKSVEWLVY